MGAKTAGKIFCKKFFFKKIDCGPKPFKTAYNPSDCGTIAKKIRCTKICRRKMEISNKTKR